MLEIFGCALAKYFIVKYDNKTFDFSHDINVEALSFCSEN